VNADGYHFKKILGMIRKTVCAPVFDMLVPLMSIELINISLPIKNTEPSSACVSLLRLVKGFGYADKLIVITIKSA
jgi:hypothetical protein